MATLWGHAAACVDCAGVVDAVGEGVTKYKVGDHVASAGSMPLDVVAEDGKGYDGPQGMMGIRRPGGFAELVCVPAFKTVPLPKNLNFHEAAVVMRHCPTAWNLLINIAKLQAGEWALIMGASGNLGTVGIQIAKNVVGAKVICTAGSRDRADIGLACGADHAIDYSSQDLLAECMKITGGKGVNVLYDNIANPKVLPKAFHAIGMNGRLVTAGAHGGPNVEIDFFHLYDNKITIKGMPGHKAADRPKCFQAAAEGKQVAVLVELKARFDERNNIAWATRLEEAGIHVVYGLVNLKVHCKLCLVVRNEADGLHRYAHVATGNYNRATSQVYTDLALFTADEAILDDVTEIFNSLTGYSNRRSYNALLVAPVGLRQGFRALVEREITGVREPLVESQAGLPIDALLGVRRIKIYDPDYKERLGIVVDE